MTHVVTTIPSVAGWCGAVAIAGLLLTGLFFVLAVASPEDSAPQTLSALMTFVCAIVGVVFCVTYATSAFRAETSTEPSTPVIAQKLGLSILPGDDPDSNTATWLDKNDTRFTKCYVKSSKTDATHVDSTLHCLREGKSVTVSKVGTKDKS